MHDETERGHQPDLGVLTSVWLPDIGGWALRVTVPHSQGPADGWAPFVFWSETAAESWLSSRSSQLVRPTVRDCGLGPNDLAYPAVLGDEGDELLVGEPMPRVHAAGVAALFAAEFRAAGRA